MAELFLGIVLSVPTRACVVDTSGCVKGRGFSGRNIVWDYDGAIKSIAEVAAEAVSEAGASLSDIKMICVTFSNPDSEDGHSWTDDLVRRALGDAPFVTSDHVSAAHAAAFGDGDGIVVVASDDSEALGAKEGKYARAGGWGDVFGGEGTVYRIMTQGLRVAARHADGRGDRTAMLADYCSLLNCSPRRLPYRIHDKHVSYMALCEVVFRCADAEDLPASRVLHGEARELVSMAKAVAGRLEMLSPRLSVIGRCFDSPVFLDVFRRCTREELPDASVEVCDRTTVEGAAILAKMEASSSEDPRPADGPVL